MVLIERLVRVIWQMSLLLRFFVPVRLVVGDHVAYDFGRSSFVGADCVVEPSCSAVLVAILR